MAIPERSIGEHAVGLEEKAHRRVRGAARKRVGAGDIPYFALDVGVVFFGLPAEGALDFLQARIGADAEDIVVIFHVD